MFAGLLAMAGMLALSSPGVRIASAEDEVGSDSQQIERFMAQLPAQGRRHPTHAATCRAALKGDRGNEVAVARAQARLQEQLAAMPRPTRYDPDAAAGFVALNNRGFNYVAGDAFRFAKPDGAPTR